MADGVVPGGQHSRCWVSGAGCVPGGGSRLGADLRFAVLSLQERGVLRVMPVSRVSIMIRHTDGFLSTVYI